MGINKVYFSPILSSACFLSYSGTPETRDHVYSYSETISLNGKTGKLLLTVPMKDGRRDGIILLLFQNQEPTSVPWVIQDIFHNYHGVAWYWREFDAPENPHKEGDIILRFKAVDYLAEIWVNGKYAGGHEGSETPFELDVTGP